MAGRHMYSFNNTKRQGDGIMRRKAAWNEI
jgi:hypothetical protein